MNRLTTLGFVIILVHLNIFLLGNVVSGGVLVVGPANVVWDPLTEPSPTYPLSIASSGVSAGMLSWNLSMQIVPSAGATGSIGFDTLSVPSSEYVFSNVPTFGLSVPDLPSTTVDPVLDAVASFSGVVLPPTATLLDVTFAEIATADGLFRLEILPFKAPDDGSFWFSDAFTSEVFDNDSSPDPALIGTITTGGNATAIPEPGAFNLALLATLYWAFVYFRGRRTRTHL